jgi:hypothetical protein
MRGGGLGMMMLFEGGGGSKAEGFRARYQVRADLYAGADVRDIHTHLHIEVSISARRVYAAWSHQCMRSVCWREA